MTERDALDRLFAVAGASATLRAMFVDSATEDDVEALSFVTRAELDRIAASLEVKAGSVILDVGCGRGGPGLAIARRTGASLVGVDRSPAAIAGATARGAVEGVASASFHVVDWTEERPGDVDGKRKYDAAVSFDALQLMPAKPALERVARALKPGARFGFTTWELARHVVVPAEVEARVVRDWRPLLVASGFVIESVVEPSGWRERQLAIYRKMRESEPALRAELGDDVAALILAEATEEPARIQAGDARRVVAIARKT